MQPSRPPPSFRAPPSCRPLTILCVDDDAKVLLIRKTLLEHAGYIVFSALTAEDALQVFGANHIDVVVSDHLLPGAPGTEMARRMKSTKPSVPILLLSGLTDAPAGIEYVDKFLEKAQGPEQLLAAITSVTSSAKRPVLPVCPPHAERRNLIGERRKRSASPEDVERRAAIMAHEINNPLDSLLDLLYLADADSRHTQERHHYLALAREEVNRICQIAHTALHESRDSQPEVINVPGLLRSVIDFYKPRLESRGISVQYRGCSGGNLAVYPGPLRQLFSNLLLNAADAMPEGGRMHTRAAAANEWTGQKRHGLRVTFADTGCGIPKENLDEIFAPFFTTKGSHGSGLGLSLVKEVVQKHGGALRVRSSTKPGHSGSVFAIFLPAA